MRSCADETQFIANNGINQNPTRIDVAIMRLRKLPLQGVILITGIQFLFIG